MKKPYDESFYSDSALKNLHGMIRTPKQLAEYLKFDLQADELEMSYCECKMGYDVIYKRNQLQYG